MSESFSTPDHEQPSAKKVKLTLPEPSRAEVGTPGWFLDSICKRAVRSDTELYDELWRRGKPLAKRDDPPAGELLLQEELALLSVLASLQDKLVLRFEREGQVFWVVFIPHSEPFHIKNISRTRIDHSNHALRDGYREGYDCLNDIMREYVAEKLWSSSLLRRFNLG